MKKDEKLAIKAITICFKPYLKPEEAYIYTNLEHSRFAQKTQEFGIFKNAAGYFKRDELDQMMSGAPSKFLEKVKRIKV